MKIFLKSTKFTQKLYQTKFSFSQIKQIYLPDLGEKIKEATIKQWHVKEGDIVEEYQPLVDVATDKLFTTIPSEYAGKIHKLINKEEETCQVGGLLLEITENNSSQSNQITKEPVQEVISSWKDVKKSISSDSLSPAVRHLIQQNNLDPQQIKGTGPSNRILKGDIINFLKSGKVQHEIQKQDQNQVQEKQQSFKIVQMTDYEKGMQKSMTAANDIPHFYYMEEIDMNQMIELRNFAKQATNQNISYMPFFIKAFSLAIKDYPIVNSLYDPDNSNFEYQQMESHNISIAIDSPKGLVVPNIKNCQNLSILEIQNELNRLRDLATQGKLSKDLQGGTISISNIGNICGTYLGPLIMKPQVCIVAIGRMQTIPTIQANQTVKKNIINVSVGCDHRVLNGATVARFIKQWKQYLENPNTFILNMK